MTDIGTEAGIDLELMLETAKRKLQDFEDGVDRQRLLDRLREASPAHPVLLARSLFGLVALGFVMSAGASLLLPLLGRDVARRMAQIENVIPFAIGDGLKIPTVLLLLGLCMIVAWVFTTFAAYSIGGSTPLMAWELRQHQKLVNEVTRLQTQRAVMARVSRSARGRTPIPPNAREATILPAADLARARPNRTLVGAANYGSGALSRASSVPASDLRPTTAPSIMHPALGSPPAPKPPVLAGVSVPAASPAPPVRPAAPWAPSAPTPAPPSSWAAAPAAATPEFAAAPWRSPTAPESSARPAWATPPAQATPPAMARPGPVPAWQTGTPSLGSSALSRGRVGNPGPLGGVLGARTGHVPVSATGPGGRPTYARTPGPRSEAPREVAPEARPAPPPPAPAPAPAPSVGARPQPVPLGVQTRAGTPLGQGLKTGRALSAVAGSLNSGRRVAPTAVAIEEDEEDVNDLPTALRVSILSMRRTSEPSASVADIQDSGGYISGREAPATARLDRRIPDWGAIDEPWLEQALQRAEHLALALPTPLRLDFSREPNLPFTLVLQGAGPAHAVRAMIQFVEFLAAIPTPPRARIELGSGSDALGRNVGKALAPYFHDGVEVEHRTGSVDLRFREADAGWTAFPVLPVRA